MKTMAWEAHALLQQRVPLNMERAEAIRLHGAIGGNVGGGGWLVRVLAWVVDVFVFRQNCAVVQRVLAVVCMLHCSNVTI